MTYQNRGYSNLTLRRLIGTEEEALRGKWLTTFPRNRNQLGQHVFTSFKGVSNDASSANNERNRILNAGGVVTGFPTPQYNWYSNVIGAYRNNDNWLSDDTNKPAAYGVTLASTNLLIDVNGIWGNPYSNGGYGYWWKEPNFHSEWGARREYYVELRGNVHIYSRRQRAQPMFILPNVNDADFYIHVKNFTRLTWYTDYGGDNVIFRLGGQNCRVILILDAEFHLWSNRLANYSLIAGGGQNHQLVIINPQNLVMNQACRDNLKWANWERAGSFTAGSNFTVRENFGYTLPWTS